MRPKIFNEKEVCKDKPCYLRLQMKEGFPTVCAVDENGKRIADLIQFRDRYVVCIKKALINLKQQKIDTDFTDWWNLNGAIKIHVE